MTGTEPVVNEDQAFDLMMTNRASAIELAQARADRMSAMFRRNRVFEKTFTHILAACNDVDTLPPDFIDKYAPEGYFDPHAVLPTLTDEEPSAFNKASSEVQDPFIRRNHASDAESAIEKNERNSDRQPMDEATAADLKSLVVEGRVPERHSWINRNGEESELTNSQWVYMRRFVERMKELTALEERDPELEAATVEVGFWLTREFTDETRPCSRQWVRSNEFYEKANEGEGSFGSAGPILAQTEPQRCDIVGVGGMYAWYKQGKDIGFPEGPNANRWFYEAGWYDTQHRRVSTPIDSITEVIGPDNVPAGRGDYRPHHGAVIESASDRSARYRAWLQRESA
jgi:hypothetical protein